MRKIMLTLIGIIVVSQLCFAQVQRVAVLSFDRVDKESDYVANALMKRDMSNIFKKI